MLQRHREDPMLLRAQEKAWDHMVTRRMYVTGGTGSLPDIEGFGRDYELDPTYSYSETCAALGDILWNNEMTQITKDAKYADLTEWLLYNAAAVGLGQDGTSYLYNNPLSCQGEVTRQVWFKCPCCPSNISRVWADLGRYLYSVDENDIWVHQYIGSQVMSDDRLGSKSLGIKVKSMLPWEGKVRVELTLDKPKIFTFHLRIPSWSDRIFMSINGTPIAINPPVILPKHQTASGYDPFNSWYLPIERSWSDGDVIEIEFEMAIRPQFTHPRVRATRGQVAFTRGPLVYCLESIDNSGIDIFNIKVDPKSLIAKHRNTLFDGIIVLKGFSSEGSRVLSIPYYLWANRGISQMTVYVKSI
jgi:DUF1680 family protein